MYTKQEASAIKQQFWTTLGKYLSPIQSATANKINWINYKTGIKNVQYKMDTAVKEAIVIIEISGDAERRDLLFNLFVSFKNDFEKYCTANWIWQRETTNLHGKNIACIYIAKEELNIFKKDDWPALISFFKENIIAFDTFWGEYKDIFEMKS